LQAVKIPVSVKISHYFSNLSGMVRKLSNTGIAGISLFNRFYNPDIDIHSENVVVADVLSTSCDYLLPLKWTGILAGQVKIDLAATSGIHNAETALKFLLSGASAVQIASVLYKEGPSAITKMNKGISDWMDQKGYKSINDFRGSLSLAATSAQAWERTQFMKYFGEKTF
jgi:dihydroorotate dehydrogenase (fumarate)